MTTPFELRHRIIIRPRLKKSGAIATRLPAKYVHKHHELALTIALSANRRLFGLVYSGIQSDYFFRMPRKSGVFICPVIPTSMIAPDFTFPGDIDLLIIPYEGDHLVLHRTLVMEIKVIRATFANPGKSPNGFGFSQAAGLIDMGFPYVAVAHLIVSDESPQTAWREMHMAKIIGPNDEVSEPTPIFADYLPMELMERALGKMRKESTQEEIGLVAAYIETNKSDFLGRSRENSIWHPECRVASLNSKLNTTVLQNVIAFFEAYPNHFLDNPRYDPT